MATWQDVINDAIIEIGSYSPGESIPNPVFQTAFTRLNTLIDEWGALERYAYNVNFTLYTLTPSHQPTLIGPGLSAPDFPTLNNQARPPRIEGASLVLNSTPQAVDIPINVRDDSWWLNNSVKGLTSTIPTDLYYSPDYPNGALYFWPVPTVAYQVRLEMWTVINEVTDPTTTFVAAQGYQSAIMYSLAERIAGPLGKEISPAVSEFARRARAALQSNNMLAPRTQSADFGTGAAGPRGGFNWKTGLPA